jgi:hypothetical protein
MSLALRIFGTTCMVVTFALASRQAVNVDNSSSERPSNETLRVEALPAPMTQAGVQASQQRQLDAEPILNRPLFEPSRRPFTSEEPAVSEPVLDEVADPTEDVFVEVSLQLPPEISLQGLLIRDGQPLALLSVSGADYDWYAVGSEFDGWVLNRVEADSVEIGQGDEVIRVELYQ